MPFGIEALMTLRIEKGYLHIGSDTDGTTLPDDLGMGGAMARKASDFIGRRSLARADALRADRHQLVGILPEDGATPLLAGAHVVNATSAGGSDGYVTSACWSPTLQRWIGLGMVRRGRARKGETVTLVDEGRRRAARLVAPCFVDAAGARLDA
jgi:sarcosine oxidase, subunit alpha